MQQRNSVLVVSKWSVLLVVLLVVTVVAAGCLPQQQALARLEELAATVHHDKNPSFTAVFVSSELTNFDHINRQMPSEFECVYCDNNHRDAPDGFVCPRARVWRNTRAEITVTDGVWEVWETVDDAEPVKLSHAEAIVYRAIYDILFHTIHEDAVLVAEGRDLFGQTTIQVRTLNVLNFVADPLAPNPPVPFKLSPHTTGEGEDLAFDWPKLSAVSFDTFAITARGTNVQRVEIYREYFASHHRTVTTLFNPEPTIQWQGERIHHFSFVAQF
jgi:hypothetical protein